MSIGRIWWFFLKNLHFIELKIIRNHPTFVRYYIQSETYLDEFPTFGLAMGQSVEAGEAWHFTFSPKFMELQTLLLLQLLSANYFAPSWLRARLRRDGDATIEIQRGEQLREFWSRYPNVTKRVKPAKNHAPIFWLLFLSFLILSIVNFDLDGGTLMNDFWHSFKNKTILTKVAKCLKLECLKKSAFF